MTTLTKPATEKQLGFIYSLLKEIDGDNAGEAMLAFTDGDPTTKSASAFIDRLKTEITGVVHAPLVVGEIDIPEGLHYIGQQVYRIRKSKSSGKRYAELLDTEAREFRYVGRKPLAGASANTLMTLDEAKVFGKAFGFCVRCCALLEDPASVEAGVGPVCAKKF
jgi:hypothetical protein